MTRNTQSDQTTGPQNDAAPAPMGNDTHSNVRTLTGCLRRGDGAKEYSLMGQDGSTWELRSDAVDLASHVGQTVTITGAVAHSTMHNMKEDSKQEAQEHGMAKSDTEHGHLTVTNMSVVANTCGQ